MSRPRTPLQSLTPSTVSNQASRIVARSLEPKTFGKLGRPSKWLTPEEKKIWRTLLRSAPAQLGENDRTLMEITCLLKAKLEKRTHTAREQSELINCLKQLGIIPKERQAVKPEADEKDEWDEVDSET